MKKLLLVLALLPTMLLAQNSWINLQYLSDNYPTENSWEILDSTGAVVVESDSNYVLNTLLDTIVPLDAGTYTFNLYDIYGDGLGASVWGGTDGWFLIQNDCQDTLAFVAGDFGSLYTETLIIAPCAPPLPDVFGCTDTTALNFDPLATANNYSCIYQEGCTNPNATNYDSTAIIDNGTCNFNYGCTDPTATNYDPTAYIDNGTCDYPMSGCTDLNSINYNPWAILDNGTCINTTSCDPVLQHQITMTIRLDNWPSETSWIMITDNDTIYTSPQGTYNYSDIGVTYSYDFCINNTAGFEFIVEDSYGDGMAGNGNPGAEGAVVIYDCDGDTITYLSSGLWLDNNGNTAGVDMGGYPDGNYLSSGIHIGNPCSGVVSIDGCTDPLYQEYDYLATNDDGSCTTLHIFGCNDPLAFNYDPVSTALELEPICNYTLVIEDDGADGWGDSYLGVLQGTNTWTFTTGPGNLTDTFYINLETDKPIKVYYFEILSGQQSPQQLAFQTLQNSFTLTNADGVILLQEGTNPFVNNSAGALQPFESATHYTYDALPYCGDVCTPIILGCMDSTAVNFNPAANTEILGSCIVPVYGCMNTFAINYDPTATVDDSTCINTVNGCLDTAAYNYDPLANVDNGGCIYLGCTDITACNYDAIANLDNGGCSYPTQYLDCDNNCLSDIDSDGICDENEIAGCTDPLSTNFDPNATDDDSTCTPYVYGCTDSTQFNYNPLANTDDLSCIPYIYGCTDFTAFNYDVNANTSDNSCIAVVIGCMDNTMYNYNDSANVSSGICIPFIYGCMDSASFNYDPLANTDNATCDPIVLGCTDPLATNFNPLANTNDNSCIPTIYGCTDSTAWNYNPLANTDNLTCEPFIYGCTNPNANNYNPLANTDDNSCILPINGCMDSTMFNYNPLANVDNGSCIPFIYGCNDVSALNFNPLANTSDNTCCYISGCMDATALNYDPNACFEPINSCVTIITGCTDLNAANYNSLANVSDSTSCLYDAGCYQGEGLPYWLNDGCFAWVIDVDEYCCTNNWDASCQSMYDYCQLGWPLGLEDLDSKMIMVYPNPSKDIFNIETRLDIKVEVYDMNGRMIINEASKRISLLGHPSGIYNMTIIYNELRINKRIVKQ